MRFIFFAFLLLPLLSMSQASTAVITKYTFNSDLSDQDKEVVIKHIKKMPLLKHASFCRKHNCMYAEQVLSASQLAQQASIKNIKPEYQHYVISTAVCTSRDMRACESDKESRLIIIKK